MVFSQKHLLLGGPHRGSAGRPRVTRSSERSFNPRLEDLEERIQPAVNDWGFDVVPQS